VSDRLFTVSSHYHQLDVFICVYLILNVHIEQTAKASFRMFPSFQNSTLTAQSIIFTSVVLEQKGYFFLWAIHILYNAKIVIFYHFPPRITLRNSIADPSNYITLAWTSWDVG